MGRGEPDAAHAWNGGMWLQRYKFFENFATLLASWGIFHIFA